MSAVNVEGDTLLFQRAPDQAGDGLSEEVGKRADRSSGDNVVYCNRCPQRSPTTRRLRTYNPPTSACEEAPPPFTVTVCAGVSTMTAWYSPPASRCVSDISARADKPTRPPSQRPQIKPGERQEECRELVPFVLGVRLDA